MTTHSDMELFLAAFGAGLSLVLSLLLLRDFRHTVAARLFVLLLVGANVHLFHQWVPEPWRGYSFVMQSATPALFWMCCRITFVSPDEPRALIWGLAFYSFCGPLLYLLIGEPQALHFTLKGIPQWLEYLLVILGWWEVIVHWNDDLVEARRRLRGGVMLATGIAVGWGIFSYNLRIGDSVSRYLAIDSAILILAWLLLQGRSELWHLLPQERQPHPAAEPDADAPIDQQSVSKENSEELQQLNQLMNTGFYRQENLTLSALAERLQLPEYRLRATINKELGYSNFNEYINQLRIGEAADRLLSETDTPITNIALDVGYRTMSSFNRAFRKIHDTTPSDYREHRGRVPQAQSPS
ncbi:helix-turn-helix domain-containing protein [Thalassolituus sp. LLYu03]|uniref:helix-turn-helix domain-containing protein n=1 Tax=Thalassolituus sp. LLYu03 TaxID=3421656 RepID=UPI003D2D9B1A